MEFVQYPIVEGGATAAHGGGASAAPVPAEAHSIIESCTALIKGGGNVAFHCRGGVVRPRRASCGLVNVFSCPTAWLQDRGCQADRGGAGRALPACDA